MEQFKGILLGIVGTVAITALVVWIASICNDITFAEQICHWFGCQAGAVAETTEEIVTETLTAIGYLKG